MNAASILTGLAWSALVCALVVLSLRRVTERRPGRSAPPARNPPPPGALVELAPGLRFEPFVDSSDPTMADGIEFPRGQCLPRTGDLIPFARASTVALLEQLSDPVLLQCIGLECLGAYSLETLTRGVHARHLQPDERRKLEEAIEVGVDPECLADIVDHVAFHDARRVWLEKNARVTAWWLGDVDEITRGATPDAMAFGLDEHAWPLPYSPSDACLAARALDAARNIVEATPGEGADIRARREKQRARNDSKARGNELKYVSRKARWRNDHGDTSGKGISTANELSQGDRP